MYRQTCNPKQRVWIVILYWHGLVKLQLHKSFTESSNRFQPLALGCPWWYGNVVPGLVSPQSETAELDIHNRFVHGEGPGIRRPADSRAAYCIVWFSLTIF